MQWRCMYYCTCFRSLQGTTTWKNIYIQTWQCLASSHWSPQKSLKSSNIKEAGLVSAKSSIPFVKKGAKVTGKRTPLVGILHQASDWVLLADLNSNYCLPDHIAITLLRPDITIFSNSLRKVILIELTCPCEGNMESWYSIEINKYLTLKVIIESNCWCVELFAVEAGAKGYCSKSILCCFKKIGFNNTVIRNTIKKLSKSSMEWSFCIWLARNKVFFISFLCLWSL